jgi:DNA-binding protein H-NS
MENKSIEELEQELAIREAETATLRAKITESKLAKHAENVASIRQLMTELEVTIDDLSPIEQTKVLKVRKGSGEKIPPKYRDAATNLTWSGRGATPNWLKAYVMEGRNRDEFLINKSE